MYIKSKSNRRFLKYASACGAKQRKGLIRNATPAEINSLCECVFNAYKRNVNLPTSIISKLHPFRKSIIKLGKNPKARISLKRRLLLQQGSGAFIPILLSSLIPVISSLFSK